MRDKRMISNTIIENDIFTDLSFPTQCLYFHLILKADDDGFVSSPKKILRSIGATEDDLQKFIKIEYSRVGASTNITPREIIRDFIELLDIVWQNPETDVEKLLNSDKFSYAESEAVSNEKSDDFAEFRI